ncbi:MAG: polymer-forming cytoskeletal protein [Proteobacteria bacterium]|nr:polymer-forming cytoskeletal protein [Pseudomonadota bacterium]MBU1716289.1 polymer-forming cytoskeletal protein [Pseudomonadota bacterium]
MSIFKKKENTETLAADNSAISSIIGKGMTIIGDISFEGKIRVDGNIEGNVVGEYLIVSDTGNIAGDIESSVVVCHGQVDGNMKVKKLHLKKGGILNGRLETTDLSVESGGILNGEIRASQQGLQLIQGSSTPPLPAPKEATPKVKSLLDK